MGLSRRSALAERRGPRRGAASVLGVAALASVTACGAAAGHPGPAPSSACTDRSRAIAIARANAASTQVTVVSAGCVRVGDVVHGANVLGPDTPVWNVVLRGRFPPAGCPAPIPPRTFAPCGPPATTERVIVDHAATRFVMAITPGPTG
jgi:hypothetical protein